MSFSNKIRTKFSCKIMTLSCNIVIYFNPKCQKCLIMFGPRVCCSRQEGVSGVGLVHQSLHRDAHFHQALLFQDMVRKTQFVLGVQREGGMNEKRWKRMDRNGMEKKGQREKRGKEFRSK